MFENDFDFLDLSKIFDNSDLDWDKKSYKFDRAEKDMHPYSITNREKSVVITHNVLGIDKKDLKVSLNKENGVYYIELAGATKDSITGKNYSISSKFALNDEELDLSNIKTSAVNGLLYIEIARKPEQKPIKTQIEVL